MSDFKAYILLSFLRCTSLTSPKAPLPMTLMVLKLSGASFVLMKRRYLASAFHIIFLCFSFFTSGTLGSLRKSSSSLALQCNGQCKPRLSVSDKTLPLIALPSSGDTVLEECLDDVLGRSRSLEEDIWVFAGVSIWRTLLSHSRASE